MAKINSGILDGFSGKVGKVSGYILRGKSIIRKRRKQGISDKAFVIKDYNLYTAFLTTFFNSLIVSIRNNWLSYPIVGNAALSNFIKFHLPYCNAVYKKGSSWFMPNTVGATYMPEFRFISVVANQSVSIQIINNDMINNWPNNIALQYTFSTNPTANPLTVLVPSIKNNVTSTILNNASWLNSGNYLVFGLRDTVTNISLCSWAIPCNEPKVIYPTQKY